MCGGTGCKMQGARYRAEGAEYIVCRVSSAGCRVAKLGLDAPLAAPAGPSATVSLTPYLVAPFSQPPYLAPHICQPLSRIPYHPPTISPPISLPYLPPSIYHPLSLSSIYHPLFTTPCLSRYLSSPIDHPRSISLSIPTYLQTLIYHSLSITPYVFLSRISFATLIPPLPSSQRCLTLTLIQL